MPRRPSATRRWLTALTWPVGMALTSWDYMWRTTVLHRSETMEPRTPALLPPPVPDFVDRTELQPAEEGYGPLFHRCLHDPHPRVAARSGAAHGPSQARPQRELPPPRSHAFNGFSGPATRSRAGDEYVVRMPGPWDGPVRVVAEDASSFRLATLAGHLEAGQIEFRTGSDAERRAGRSSASRSSRGRAARGASPTCSISISEWPRRSSCTCGSRSWRAWSPCPAAA